MSRSIVPNFASIVVDASVWVAFFIPADIAHRASFTWISQHTANGGKVIAPAILLTEVAAAISRRLEQPDTALHTANTLEQLPSAAFIAMDSTLMKEATNIAARLGIRGADAIYVAVAKQLDIPLLTLDEEQLTRGASTITTIRPYEHEGGDAKL